MAGKPRRLARSAGTDIADSLPPPHAPAHNAGQRRGKQAYRACGEAPTGAPQRRGPGVRVVIGARALAFTGDKHSQYARRTRYRGRCSATPFMERSTRRRHSRSAAARSQDAAVYGRCSRPPPGTLMNLSKRQHLPRRGLLERSRPNSPFGHLFRSYNLERTGGLLLASKGGLILDSASEPEYRIRRLRPCDRPFQRSGCRTSRM